MRHAAFLPAVKLVVALPDGLAVLAVGMPHFGAVPPAAVTAFYPAGENARAARPVLTGMPGRHLVLHFFKYGRADDGLVVVLHIILRHLSLIHFFLLGEEIHCVHFLKSASPLYFSFVRMLLTVLDDHSFLPPGEGMPSAVSSLATTLGERTAGKSRKSAGQSPPAPR